MVDMGQMREASSDAAGMGGDAGRSRNRREAALKAHRLVLPGAATSVSALAIVVALGLAPLPGPALAQSNTWSGTTSSDWFIGSNWSNGVPAAGQTVIINTLSPNETIIATAGAVARDLFISNGSDAVLTVTGTGTVNADYIVISDAISGTGTLNVSNSGVATAETAINVGQAGSGVMNLTGGGTATARQVHLGSDLGVTGTINVDGAGSEIRMIENTNNLTFTVGGEGRGVLNVANGGQAVAEDIVIVGSSDTGIGEISVSGSSSLLRAEAGISVGNGGTGTVLITDGALFQSPAAALGFLSTADGTVEVSGAGSRWVNSATGSSAQLFVGAEGIGRVRVVDGGSFEHDGLAQFGTETGSSGTLVVDGDDSFAGVSRSSFIGLRGEGRVEVTNGGALSTGVVGSTFGLSVQIGSEAGSTGVVRVDGGGSFWGSTQRIETGRFGEGTIEVVNGGTLQIANALNVAVEQGAVGTVLLSGSGSVIEEVVDVATLHRIAGRGTGLFTIDNGASATFLNSLHLGNGATADATLVVTGAGSTLDLQNGAGLVFAEGTTRIEIRNGATLQTTGSVGLGLTGPGNQTMIVTGAGTTALVGDDTNDLIAIGRQPGTSTFEVTDGATLSTTSFFFLASDPASVASLLIDGSDTRVNADFGATIASQGAATVTLSGGAVFSRSGTGPITIASGTGSSGTLNIGGAGAAAAPGELVASRIRFGDGAGTINFNHTASDFEFTPGFEGNGILNFTAGTTRLSGDGTSFSGVANVDGGNFAITGILGGTTNIIDGTLSGTGELGDVTVADGGILSPGTSPGTLTVATLVLNNGSILDFELGTSDTVGGDNDLIVVNGNLTLDGILNVTARPTFGNGEYTLIQYGNLAADNGLVTGTTPAGYIYTLDSGTGTNSAVTLAVSGGVAGNNQYWDGTGPVGDGTVNGGSGVWNAANTNWTNQTGTVSEVWGSEFAIFRGDAGTVTVDGTLAFTGMQFLTDGYRIEGGAGGLLQADPGGATIWVGSGITTTFDIAINGGILTKVDAGTLELESAGNARWMIEGGEVAITGDVILPNTASVAERDFFTVRNGATLRVANGGALLRGAGTDLASRIAIDGMANIIVEDGGLLEGTISSDLEGTPPGDSNGNRIMIAGTMSLNDASERMISVNGSDNVVEIASTGVIESFGNRQYGIILHGGRDDMIIPGDGDRNIVTVDGRIETHGDGAAGIDIIGNDNIISVGAGGVVQTHGARSGSHYATGVITGGDNNEIDIAGLVATEADFISGLPISAVHMWGTNNRLNISGTATTAGTDTPTVVLSGGSSTMTLSGTVAAASAAETAILFENAASGAAGNTLELRAGFSITGLVVGDIASQNDLILGGDSGTGTFDVGAIGDIEQYRFFDTYSKQGDSTWILTGTNNTGPTFWGAYGGTLIVNAEMTSTGFSNYDNIATIGGHGTVGYLELLDNATFAPGDATTPVGTFNVAGNANFNPGSTFAVEIIAPNQSDLLSATGTVTINGGEVVVSTLSTQTSYQDGQSYRIIEADGGVVRNTDFDYINPFLFLSSSLAYGTNYVDIVLQGGGAGQNFTSVAQTYNQFQSAIGLNDLAQSGDSLAVYNALLFLTDAGAARRAYDLASGEVHAAGRHVIDQTFGLFGRTLRAQGMAGIGSGTVGAQTSTSPLGYGATTSTDREGATAISSALGHADTSARGAWATSLGSFGQVSGDGNAAYLDYWNAGLAGGYEGVVDVATGQAVGGIGFGYIRSHGSVDARLSTFDSDGLYLGAYGAWTDGSWNLAGSLAYGLNRVSTQRDIAFIGRTAKASYWTHTVGFSGEASLGFDVAAATRIAPLLTIDAGWSGHGGFTEKGAGALNLSSGSQGWSRLDSGLGLALSHAILTENGRLVLESRAVWEHAFADVVPSQALSFGGSPTGFSVSGPNAGRDHLRVGAGLAWDVSRDMTVRARYDGLVSGRQANHSASLDLKFRF